MIQYWTSVKQTHALKTKRHPWGEFPSILPLNVSQHFAKLTIAKIKFRQSLPQTNLTSCWEPHSALKSIITCHPLTPGSFLSSQKHLKEKMSILPRLIGAAGCKKADILIEPILVLASAKLVIQAKLNV